MELCVDNIRIEQTWQKGEHWEAQVTSGTLHRQEQNRANMAKRRSIDIFVENVITTFLLKTKIMCAHAVMVMMYKQNVIPCNNFYICICAYLYNEYFELDRSITMWCHFKGSVYWDPSPEICSKILRVAIIRSAVRFRGNTVYM